MVELILQREENNSICSFGKKAVTTVCLSGAELGCYQMLSIDIS